MSNEIPNQDQMVDLLMKRARRQIELSGELINQGMAPIQATVVAGDLVSAEEWSERVKNGEDPTKCFWCIGSYARFEWARKHLPKEIFEKNLIDLWRDSDPNDSTDILPFWESQKTRIGEILIDENPLPDGDVFVIYRGQAPGNLGISWSLDQEVAKRFARTGGGRVPIPNGSAYVGRVHRKDVIAYITGRGEQEIIVDPKKISFDLI